MPSLGASRARSSRFWARRTETFRPSTVTMKRVMVASVDVLPGPPVSEAEKALVGEPSPAPPVSEAEKALVGEPSAAPPVSEAEKALVGEPGPPGG